MTTSKAPAKINLFLHVGSPRADGYHPLESLVAFAECSDELQFEPGKDAYDLHTSGAFAEAAGDPEHNLVLKAARALKKRVPSARGGSFHLKKNLPAGAGIGGGSADAAAALRLIAKSSGIEITNPALYEAARDTGADVAVCIEGKARLISGIGEILSEPVTIPPLHAVLVWPGEATSTPAVYRAFDEAQIHRATPFGIRASDIPAERSAFVQFLAKQNNDLSRAAWRVTPHVAEADATLRAVDRAKLIRMTGSGSTVFALYDSPEVAALEAQAVSARYPNWWVKATTLR